MRELLLSLRRRWHNLFVPWRPLKNLWIDDMRPAPRGWHWVGTEDEAIDFLMSNSVDKWSLDHDLGPGGDVYNVLVWLVEQRAYGVNFWPLSAPGIHTMNPVGRDNMKWILKYHSPYTPTWYSNWGDSL